MLSITNLSVQIKEKKILNNITYSFEIGKNYAIIGRNGSGKSSLALTLMGHPNYEIVSGSISLSQRPKINKSEKHLTTISSLSPDARAKLGIFIAFQHIPEIPGVKLFEFLKGIYDQTIDKPTTFMEFKSIVEPLLLELNLTKEFLWRDLNVGFSGGERRKFEVLQIQLLKPNFIILDEIDSGLDVDAFKEVTEFLADYNSPNNTFIIITHIFSILDYIPVNEVVILKNGQIDKEGGPELINEVRSRGFE